MQAVGLIVVAGAIVCGLEMYLAMVWTGGRGWFGKIWSVILAASCLYLVWFEFVGRLMTLSLNY